MALKLKAEAGIIIRAPRRAGLLQGHIIIPILRLLTVAGGNSLIFYFIKNMSWQNSFKKQSSEDLACAIVDASYKCGQEFKESIDEKFGKDTKEAMNSWMQVQYEFLFFFIHLAMRFTLSKLGNEKRIRLQDLLCPILMNSTTEAWFGHWPEKFKEGIKNDFIHNINVSEMDYSECRGGLLIKDKPFSEDGLFSRLSRNIARLSGNENNPETIMRCTSIVIKKFVDMKLDQLIDSVDKEL